MGVPMFRGWHAVGSDDDYVACYYCGSRWEERQYFEDDGFTVKPDVTSQCNGVDGEHAPECECYCCAYEHDGCDHG